MVEKEYAKAIYELAIENGKEDTYNEYFMVVNENLRNKEYYDVLTSPFIDLNKQKEVINNVYKEFDETFINFLNVLLDHHRLSKFSGIYEEYQKLLLNKKNIVKVQIVSADHLDKKQLAQFEETLKLKYSGKKVDIENIVNPELIGGVQVLANGQAIDVSLKHTLQSIKDSL